MKSGMKTTAVLLILAASLCQGGWARAELSDAADVVELPAVAAPEKSGKWSPQQKMLAVNAVALTGLAAYGVSFWDYGDRTMHSESEHWFGRGTKSGGADKVGHFYTSYLAGRGFAALASYLGYDDHGAARVGALSSFLFTLGMEVGDSYSDFGFSHEDFVANTIGSFMAYLLADNPKLDALVAFRIEYYPRQSPQSDLVTDYENMRFLAALKFAGFDTLKSGPLRYLELVGGYYARDFDKDGRRTPKRNLFVGVGLNLSEVFRGWRGAGVFNYVQVPRTYVEAKHTF
jgi:hypothetical protein